MSLGQTLPTTISTERLALRAPVLADLVDMVAMANNPKMVETTATLPFPFTESDARDLVERSASTADARIYAIAGANNRFMGTILFKLPPGNAPEIGYWLGEPHWGKGLAGEAVAGLVAASSHLTGFQTIKARVLESNPASVRVLEKCGFVVIERTLGVVERHRGKPLLVMQWSAP